MLANGLISSGLIPFNSKLKQLNSDFIAVRLIYLGDSEYLAKITSMLQHLVVCQVLKSGI